MRYAPRRGNYLKRVGKRWHYRRGVPGDWVNHFESDHVRVFKGRYDDLLIKLGYEKNEGWDLGVGQGMQ